MKQQEPTSASDLELPPIFEGCDPELIDANGTKYLVGRGKHGYVTIAHVDLHELPEEGKTHVALVGTYPLASFPNKDELLEALSEA